MRTKQEVINFLEDKVGTKVVCKGNPSLDGQCVTLIKALMEFLGVDNPYKARGHGKDCINTYLNEGIADPGTGFISVFSNKNMGGGYGHVWCNAGEGDGTYYESNGSVRLTVTKGQNYSYDNICNFDKYIKGDDMSDLDTCLKQHRELVDKCNALEEEVDTLVDERNNALKALEDCQNQGDWIETGKKIVKYDKDGSFVEISYKPKV